MDFRPSPRSQETLQRLRRFMREHIEPVEADYLHDAVHRSLIARIEIGMLRKQMGSA